MPRDFGALAVAGRKCHITRKNSLAALVLATFLPAFAIIAESAVPGHDAPCGDEAEEPAPLPTGAQEKVTDCLLQRPFELTDTSEPGVHITYPALGHKQVDTDIREWVTDLADAFVKNFDFRGLSCDLSGNLEQDQDLGSDDGASYELWGSYYITRPSHLAVSIAFELWNYTGAAEANLDILTLNYSLATGQRLTLVDIFEKPEIALQLMSEWARKILEERLGASRRAAMLQAGTEPLIENFSSLSLTPDGICINFQPWQVAPSSAGIQRVNMPLAELIPAAPLLALWGK